MSLYGGSANHAVPSITCCFVQWYVNPIRPNKKIQQFLINLPHSWRHRQSLVQQQAITCVNDREIDVLLKAEVLILSTI
jgi:hypothetical protein